VVEGRVQDREHEPTARSQRLRYGGDDGIQDREVHQNHVADDSVVGAVFDRNLGGEVANLEPDVRVVPPGGLDQGGTAVHAIDGRAVVAEQAGEPTVPTAEVPDPLAGHVADLLGKER